MTFPRVRQPGLWLLGSVLVPNEAEQLDDHQSKAVDGYAGGTYAPSGPIVLGASGGNTTGLHVTSILEADQLTGFVQVGGGLTWPSGSGFELSPGVNASINCDLVFSALSGPANTLSIGGGGLFHNQPGKLLVTQFGTLDVAAGGTETIEGALTLSATSLSTWLAGATVNDASTRTLTGPNAYNGASILLQHTPVIADALSPVVLGGALTCLNVVSLEATVNLTSAQPSSSADPGANTLWSTAQVKAWGYLHCDGLGNVVVLDGYNIQGIQIIGSGVVLITFKQPMATANYAVLGGLFISPTYSAITLFGYTGAVGQTATNCELAALKGFGPSDVVNLGTTPGFLSFAVLARQ